MVKTLKKPEEAQQQSIKTSLYGTRLIEDPLLNKGNFQENRTGRRTASAKGRHRRHDVPGRAK